ncbi:MAG TPA: porin family protein [Balneolaceae bacterium]|nr:porin family protein [Balneolaceae bacterium]
MKRVSLIAVFLIALTTAFSIPKAQAQLGLRAGVNFASYNDINGNVSSRTGFLVGAYYELKVPMSPLSIQPEVTYNQKGAESSGTKIKVDYIEVPVLAKLSFSPGPITPHISAGPYAGFVVSSKAENGGTSVDINNAQTDFGGIVGAGIDINAGVTKLNLGARYGFGFADAFDGGSGKNSVFSIVAGLRL